MTQAEPVVYCVRHPDTETVLACGRCSTPICPRCMVFTPGGIRCPDCALLRRPPMYELAPTDYVRAAIAAAIAAVPLGFLGMILLPPSPRASIIVLAIALFAGVGAGTVIAEAMWRATNRKRGRSMQLIAIAGVLLAATLRLFFAGFDPSVAIHDLPGSFAAIIAAVSAWGRLQ